MIIFDIYYEAIIIFILKFESELFNSEIIDLCVWFPLIIIAYDTSLLLRKFSFRIANIIRLTLPTPRSGIYMRHHTTHSVVALIPTCALRFVLIISYDFIM